MKLIIQIPCLNEASTLPATLADLPRRVPGFESVEWLVVDDGSTDGTADTARSLGVDHIVRHTANRGLAQAFSSGLDACLALGADVIVNTDADNQYAADDIQVLVGPILRGEAEMVVGARPIAAIDDFSPVKRLLQRLGSWVVRFVSGTDVTDAPSGFRAFSRGAAQRVFVFSDYTYTLETIIQAGQKNLAVTSVPVRVNGATRPSRLIRSIPSYVVHSVVTMVRILVIYRPARFFGVIAAIFLAIGILIGLRFLWYYLQGEGDGHVQSLILASILTIVGFQTLLIAFVADLMAANRKLLEDIRHRQRAAAMGVEAKSKADIELR
jgi:glycosyltransferase involved in cell wall biosynthesis